MSKIRTIVADPKNFRLDRDRMKRDRESLKPHFKPKGLWYAEGYDWLAWMYEDWESRVDRHIESKAHFHTVNIADMNILKIDESNFLDFEAEYAISNNLSDGVENFSVLRERSNKFFTGFIRWDAVAEKYSGIEIMPHLWEHRLESVWYNGWDCSSGCIWNPDVFLSVTETRTVEEVIPEVIQYNKERWET